MIALPGDRLQDQCTDADNLCAVAHGDGKGISYTDHPCIKRSALQAGDPALCCS